MPNKLKTDVAVREGSVTSADGLQIGYVRYGAGPSLVVCHGAFTVADHWAQFGLELGATHTVYIYDRRGRGRSPVHGQDYTATSEIDDLKAVMAIAGPEASVLGHSFGGGCALAFALREEFNGRIVLYEPVHSMLGSVSRGQTAELRQRLSVGAYDDAAAFALGEIVGAPRTEIEIFRQSPLWPAMLEMVTLFPNELDFLDTLTWTREEVAALKSRVWLLLGSMTKAPPGMTSPIAALVDAVVGPTLYSIEGQGHVAYLFDPKQLADHVRLCLI